MDTRDINIDELKRLSEKKQVEFLCNQPEDQWFERKSARATALKIANAMVGFANAEGGTIVIGIHEGQIEGIKTSKLHNGWRQAAIDHTIPPVRHSVKYLPCKNSNGEQDELMLLEIEASDHVHTNQKRETYLRVGDEIRKLTMIEARELLYDKGEATYDSTIVQDAATADLDSSLVQKYVKNVGGDIQHADNVLKARGLAKEQKGIIVPTIAGLLMLGLRPQEFLPHAYIRVLKYNGSSRETGARANVTYDQRIEGTLGNQIERARRSLRKLLPQAIRLGGESQFEETTIVPQYVWLEAIVNAVVHRSYSIGGDHVRIELFNDRVEVRSPGRLPGLVQLDNIRTTRFARNPRVARALSDLRYGRELGEGVNRMFEEMHIAGLPDPIYNQGSAFVRVVLLQDSIAGKILKYLPDGSEKFVEYMSREGRVTTAEAAELLGIARPTARRYLNGLQDKGLVQHIGTSSMDPRGFWQANTGDHRRTDV